MKKIIWLLVLLVLSTSVLALRVTLNTPSVTFRSTQDKILRVDDTVGYHIGLINKNDYPIGVSITPPEGYNFSIDMASVELDSNQSIDLQYTLVLPKSGNYSTTIAVVYTALGGNETPSTFSLQQMVNFVGIEPLDISTAPEELPLDSVSTSGSGGGYVPTKRMACAYAGQCFTNNTLEGCVKQDCNWCCYNECTLLMCYNTTIRLQDTCGIDNCTNVTMVYVEPDSTLQESALNVTVTVQEIKHLKPEIYVALAILVLVLAFAIILLAYQARQKRKLLENPPQPRQPSDSA